MSKKQLPKGIRKRGEGFQVDVSHKGKRQTATVASLEEAIKTQARFKHEMLNEEDAENVQKSKSGWTLGYAMQRTRETVWNGTPSLKTQWANASQVMDFFGKKMLLKDIDTDAVDDLIRHLKKQGNSNGTVNRKVSTLSKCFSVAAARSKQSGVYLKPQFERQKEGKGRIRYLSDAEEAQILTLSKQWSKQDHWDAYVVLIDTGMRCGELLSIEKQDVTTTQDILMICGRNGQGTKNGDIRGVPMTSRVKEVLNRRGRLLEPGDRLFPYSHWWIRSTWDKIRERLDLDGDPEFVPHICRHTCASRLVQRGVPIVVVKEWLGHKSIQVTMRYAKLAPSNLVEAVKVLDNQPNTL